MMIEVLYLSLLLTGGLVLCKLLRISGWVVLPLGFLSSLSIYISVAYGQIILGLSTKPIYTLLAFSVFTIIGLFFLFKNRTVRLNDFRNFVLVLLFVVLVVTFFRNISLVKFHYDPFRYLMTGSLIAADRLEYLSSNLLEKRLSAVSIMHAPANIAGEIYFGALTPLISASVLAISYWFVAAITKSYATFKKHKLLLFTLPLLLITNRGYVWHSFYLNGHLLCGAFFLLVVGIGWLISSAKFKTIEKNSLVIIQALAAMGMVYTREEAPILAVLALAPTLLSGLLQTRQKILLALALGVAILFKQGVIFLGLKALNGQFSLHGSEQLLIGVALVASLPLLGVSWITRKSREILILIELGLWAALAIMFFSESGVLVASLKATWDNLVLGSGGWGLSIVIAWILALLAFVLLRFKNQILLRFPVTTFIPVVFLLAYFRGGAYRIGITDSLNRMWVQALPALLLYVVVAFLVGKKSYSVSDNKVTIELE